MVVAVQMWQVGSSVRADQRKAELVDGHFARAVAVEERKSSSAEYGASICTHPCRFPSHSAVPDTRLRWSAHAHRPIGAAAAMRIEHRRIRT
jgi:hypothetical protein